MSYASSFNDLFRSIETLPSIYTVNPYRLVRLRSDSWVPTTNHRFQGIRESSKFNLSLNHLINNTTELHEILDELITDLEGHTLDLEPTTTTLAQIEHARIQLNHFIKSNLQTKAGTWI